MTKVNILLLSFLVSACYSKTLIVNPGENLTFSSIESDYGVIDLNNYGCEPVDSTIVEHILKTGTIVSRRDVHDYYDTTGCSIEGSIKIDNSPMKFTFEYGGIVEFGDGVVLGCGEQCCTSDFKYCSWDADGLKGD